MKTFISWLAHSDERPVAEQVWSGVKIALYFVAGFACFITYVVGISYAVVGAPFKAIAYLSPSLPILYFTVHRWVRFLPGFLFLGALTGARSDRTVESGEVLIIVIALAASAFLSLQLLNRELNWIDRIATVIAVACPVAGAAMGGRAQSAGSLAMTAALAIPWLMNRRRVALQSDRGPLGKSDERQILGGD